MATDIQPFADRVVWKARERITEPPPPSDIYMRSTSYVGYHAESKRRMRTLDAIVSGNWATVWPDDTVTQNMPKVADLITSDLEDVAQLTASANPTVVVDPENDMPASVDQATLRQQVIGTYRKYNRLEMMRHQLALDLAGCGLACVVVWPSTSGDPRNRYPVYMRKDPRNVYPDPGMRSADEVGSVIIAYRTKARLLAPMHPNVMMLYSKRDERNFEQADLDVFEYYDADWSVKVAARSIDGKAQAVELARFPNYTGTPLALITTRPSVDGQIRGQFDKAIAPLGTANRLMELHLAAVADEVYSEKQVIGVWDNPQDIGPGATLYSTDYQAQIRRTPPAGSHPQLFNDIASLIEQARQAAGVPASRAGHIEQSIASAQFVNATQGKYITMVKTYQDLLADLEARANSAALAVDEMYMDWPNKAIATVSGGRSIAGVYTPSLDIAGAYDNRVVYGAGSQVDAYNRRLAVIQDVEYGLTSKRTARSQLDYQQDVIAEEAEVAREALESAFLAGLNDPAASLMDRARGIELFASGMSIMEVAQQMAAELAQQQQQVAEQAAAEESLAPVEETAGLPALGGLMGGR